MTASFRTHVRCFTSRPIRSSGLYTLRSSVCGQGIEGGFDEVNIGYSFTSKGRGIDLERIYEYGDESE